MGRTAIHELMRMTSDVRKEIDKTESTDAIRAAADRQGMKTLRDNCIDLVIEGKTTVEEMLRVAYTVE